MADSPHTGQQFNPDLWAGVGSPLNLYVHLPFCPRKCRFCFYYTVRSFNETRCLRYVDRVLEELRAYEAAGAFDRSRICSVYLGGGTPTAAGETALHRLLAGIRDTVPVERGAEITVEAFPEDLLYTVLPALREEGVTRLSLGIQTLDESTLALNRRPQTPEESLRFLRFAQAAGFSNVNIDLMYGLPGQSADSLRATMEGCLAEEPAHITAYRCVIAPATAIFRMGGIDGVPLPGKAEKDTLGHHCFAILREGGYERYAVDHFTRDERYRSLHEVSVWSGDNFLGLGASGLSHIDGNVFRNRRSIRRYLDPAAGFPLAEFHSLAKSDRMQRWLLLNLTKLLRVDASEFRNRFGAVLDEKFGAQLGDLAQRGWLTRFPEGVSSVTDEGAENIHALSLILTSFGDPVYDELVTGATPAGNAARPPYATASATSGRAR
jgi:coproporphyrinogen III oxidase-like Fe-S oxidoreductase